MASLEERIDLVGAKMTLRSPFISAVFTTVVRKVCETGSAGTNGEFIAFGREFCDKLTEEELLGLALHEACHIVLGHIWRTEGYDPNLANVAQDAVINHMLLKMGFTLPKGGVRFPWVTDEMDWEEVYRKLKEQCNKMAQKMQQAGGSGQGQGQGNPVGLKGKPQAGDGKDSGKPVDGMQDRDGMGQEHPEFGRGGFDGKGDCDPAPSEARKADIEATILTAAKMARACGDGSLLVDKVIGAVGKATVSWIDETRAMLQSASRDDYSFMRASRRLMSQGYYLPSLYSEAMGGLAVGFDMSGSMSADDAQRIANELQGVVEDCNPDWVEVAFFADRVGRVQRFERGEELALKPDITGGTRFVPVFKHFAKVAESERIAGMIFFTDMESSDLMQCEEPAYPVLWGNVMGKDDVKVPFGRVIRIAI